MGFLQSRNSSVPTPEIKYECNVSLYSIENTVYPAHQDSPGKFRIQAVVTPEPVAERVALVTVKASVVSSIGSTDRVRKLNDWPDDRK